MIDVDRRRFLRSAAAASATFVLGQVAAPWRLHAQTAPSARRRIFEITTRIEILQPSGPTRVWVPTPLAAAPYQETLGDTYQLVDEGRSVMVESRTSTCSWPNGRRGRSRSSR